MTVSELINALRSHPGELEVLVSADDDLWQVNLGSFRETTLHGTTEGDIVEPEDYDREEDGEITDTRQVLLIDLNL